MKFVRCLRGKVYDVIVDIRPTSPSFLSWHGEILSADNMRMLCAPEGFAHGFQTIEEHSEVLYLTTNFYSPDSEGGLRYDDPALGIKWPLDVTDVSAKDSSHPLLGSNPDPLLEI
jgi:dTDP-4-dehydrorhamnose 3,5-epimerase